MNVAFFNYEWVYWNTIDSVTFDGVNKLIIVNEGVSSLDISSEVYSAWKRWVAAGFGVGFPPAIRSVGGDPIDVAAGQYAGDLYFLINGWKLIVDLEKVAISGILYSDDYNTAYYLSTTQPVYPATVSNIVAKQVITEKALTATDIAEIVAAMWDAKIAEYLIAGSFGQRLGNTATSAEVTTVSDKVDNVPTEVWNHTQ